MIDTAAGTVVTTLQLGGVPKQTVADGKGMIYDNIEDKNEVVAIDFRTLKINAHWPAAPAGQPVSIAMDPTPPALRRRPQPKGATGDERGWHLDHQRDRQQPQLQPLSVRGIDCRNPRAGCGQRRRIWRAQRYHHHIQERHERCAPGSVLVSAEQNARCAQLRTNEVTAKIGNTFGGTLGGPVWIPRLYGGKNRTFFYFTWEAFRFPRQTTIQNMFRPAHSSRGRRASRS